MIFAEVIGDPVGHSLSPTIHRHWLRMAGLKGDYRATRVGPADLAKFLDGRRSDPDWRGCNVTMPHKVAVLGDLDDLDASARTMGAVNTIVPIAGRLIGFNSDGEGIAAALDDVPLRGKKAVIIGAGGAARAAAAFLFDREIGRILLLVRDPAKAAAVQFPCPMTIVELKAARDALYAADLVINASPLGMDGFNPMPSSVLDGIRRHCGKAVLFDMVTRPVETEFLNAVRAKGAGTKDGLTMLVGQAAKSFELFFGVAAPGSVALRSELMRVASGRQGEGKEKPRQ